MKHRFLTKSRYKLGLECPNKLFYTKKKQYANTQNNDSFLKALAQGGFQVEELARMEYPHGHLIEGKDGDYDWLVEKTNQLLQKDNVVIYEAAFKFEDYFIRTDILVKKGNNIELIEVKAKSYDPFDEHIFIGKRGGIVSSWKTYLFDVAFQKYVIQKYQPTWNIKSFLMMANKRSEAKIDGLNQLFRISNKAGNRTGIIKKVNTIEEIKESVLGKIEISNIINDIQNGKYKALEELDFKESIQLFSEHYTQDKKINYPVSFKACKKCEFKATNNEEANGFRSGFKECWSEQKGFKKQHFEKPMLFEIGGYNSTSGQKLFDNNIFFMNEITEDDLNVKIEAGKISSSERKWVQVEKVISEDNSSYILKEELKEEMDSWTYPLHFIDFETSTVPLPFHKGRKPYEQIAFQFSHHKILKNGKIKHESEFISFKAGKFPNFDFIRALRKSLGSDDGTIFKFATHENTIVNAIWEQLNDSKEPDQEELKSFIQEISHSKKDSTIKWKGRRDMIDMCELVKKYYYNPLTKGSNSIKKVLPASLLSSKFLQNKYTKEIGKIGISSKNFSPDHIWIEVENDNIKSPYEVLPPLFEGWTQEQLDATISELDNVADGGGALTAYGKLQYTNMSNDERKELRNALLKYCELDTLAMVMIYEHWKEIID